MTDSRIMAPDLRDGFILNGDENLWQTDVQCVLSQEGAQQSTAYLSHECRAERLPFSETYLGGGGGIFQKDNPWEFLTYSQNGMLYQAVALGLGESENFGGVDGVVPPVVPLGRQTRPKVAEREIRLHQDIGELVADLVAGRLSVRDLYLRVAWQKDQRRYTLFTPCRYINFSNPDKQQVCYVQPISGAVLFPHYDYGDYYIPAYVACAMNDKGETVIEFCTRNYRHAPDYFKERLENLSDEAAQAVPSAYILADDAILSVQGEGAVFSYLD